MGINFMARKKPRGRSLLERLLDLTEINQINDCWIWQGGKNNIGYGMMRDESKMRTAHRVSYEEHNNVKIPNNQQVLHICGNRDCVNPNHLKLGTRQDVSDDLIASGKARFWGVPLGQSSRLGKKSPRMICPHCNRDIAKNVYVRYHGDKCKQNVK